MRKKNELKEALNCFQNFKNQLNTLNSVKDLEINQTIKITGDSTSLRNFFEVGSLIDVAIVITNAALSRSKSLGAHYIEI